MNQGAVRMKVWHIQRSSCKKNIYMQCMGGSGHNPTFCTVHKKENWLNNFFPDNIAHDKAYTIQADPDSPIQADPDSPNLGCS
jgi:hypothetical protein